VPAWKVVSDGQDIWTIDEAEGTITRIDAIRNAVGTTVDTRGGILPRVANGLVWVVGHERLVIVDSATAQIVGEYALTGEVGYVEVGFGSVWIPRFDGNEVWRIDYPLPS